VATYCPTANITIRLETYSQSVTWAIANDIDIISSSISGMEDHYQLHAAEAYADSGIGTVYAHGSNTHIEYGNPHYLDYIVTVGCGTNGISTGSYGYGLEWFINGTAYESWAAAISTGMIAQLMIDHNWTFNQARQALRQTASNWVTGWKLDGGFGYLDYAAADSLITNDLYKLNCIHNILILSNYEDHIRLMWDDSFNEIWDISSTTYPALDSTVTTNEYYNPNHGIDDAGILFGIAPDSSRVETYSTKGAHLIITPPAAPPENLTELAAPIGQYVSLRPDGDIGTGWAYAFPYGSYYTTVDEVILNTEDWLYYEDCCGGSSAGELSLADTEISSGVINNVIIAAVIGRGGYNSYYAFDINGTPTPGELITDEGASRLITQNYATNPDAGAWTWEEIDSLTVGIRLGGGNGEDLGLEAVYQLYIAVDYTPATTASSWVSKICGSEAASKVGGVEVANIHSVMGVE
jgi:hypothetical protein